MTSEIDDNLVCPKCGVVVYSQLECPTYFRKGILYRCTPPCGNTVEYWCPNETECGWTWVKKMNPMNPRYDANLRNNPDWLKH